eukprot:TRINITY_DN4648_c0_g1_i1.p1 TRINITY_DN4648_c0_g1~~TRINITY_DN4648_c0_g1_i1.p1  ORF type:complete len:148 (+),score=49.01 TRINITY_DN4648_c0_g1_i1:132-575(+)
MQAIQQIWRGMRDGINVLAIHRVFSGNNSVSVKFVDILVFNFVINFGSLFVFQNYCEPLISSLFNPLLQSNGISPLFSYSSIYLHWFVWSLFYSLWAIPVFLISFILNGHWLSVISESASTSWPFTEYFLETIQFQSNLLIFWCSIS